MILKITVKCLFLLIFALETIASFGQDQTVISGTVYDNTTGKILPGATIKVKDKLVGTITQTDGGFKITINQSPPLKLIFSYVGFKSQEVSITKANTSGLDIRLEEQVLSGQEIVVSASRIEESILTSPVTIEKLDILDVQNTASTNFYEGLATLKGVDFSTQSLTFRTINTRGFGSNGNTRFVQLIDGIDNQAPGLNFSVGNIAGINDLDLESAEMIPGAASALYGPNAIQGILLLNSKNPFDYQGLSAYVKMGVNHIDKRDDDMALYQDYAFRWAKSLNDRWAIKLVGSYLSAQDFRGVDFRDQGLATYGAVHRGESERGDNRFYDGVNVYGDFGISVGAIADGAIARGDKNLPSVRSLIPDGNDGFFTPRGYSEASFIDNTTESIKLGGALHYRLSDGLELFGQFNYGSGSTAYTANDRFVFDDFSVITGKVELRSSNFYLRSYTTRENSGDTYASNTLASLINQETYLEPYLTGFVESRLIGGSIEEAHAVGRTSADAAQPQPGSAEFDQLSQKFRSLSIADGGAKFIDKSALYHTEGSWVLNDKIDWAEIVVGGNFRRFALNSKGTIFALDENGNELRAFEYGGYTQITKKLMNDNLRLQGSLRYDKNEFFKGQLSPRLSAVQTIAGYHNLRASFQRGFRIPTIQDQFIDLDVVTRRLIGSNALLVDRYNFKTNTIFTTESVVDAKIHKDPSKLVEEKRINDEFKTEKVNTYEIGYKGLFLNGRLFVDTYYYYSIYNDFIAEIRFTQAVPKGLTEDNPDSGSELQKSQIVNGTVDIQNFGFDINAEGLVKSHGWAAQIDYTLYGGWAIGGNIAYNKLISQEDLLRQGFRANYNTPKYRFNLKFSNRKVTEKMGFNINYRWQQAFLWESAFGTGIIPEFGSLDAQLTYKVPDLKSSVKLGASNLLNKRYTTSFGNPSLGGIYYIQVTFDEFFK